MRLVLLSCLLLPTLVLISRFYVTKPEQEITTETLNVNIQVNFLLTPLVNFNVPLLNSTLQKATEVTVTTTTYKPLQHIIENIQRHKLAIFQTLIDRNHFFAHVEPISVAQCTVDFSIISEADAFNFLNNIKLLAEFIPDLANMDITTFNASVKTYIAALLQISSLLSSFLQFLYTELDNLNHFQNHILPADVLTLISDAPCLNPSKQEKLSIISVQRTNKGITALVAVHQFLKTIIVSPVVPVPLMGHTLSFQNVYLNNMNSLIKIDCPPDTLDSCLISSYDSICEQALQGDNVENVLDKCIFEPNPVNIPTIIKSGIMLPFPMPTNPMEQTTFNFNPHLKPNMPVLLKNNIGVKISTPIGLISFAATATLNSVEQILFTDEEFSLIQEKFGHFTFYKHPIFIGGMVILIISILTLTGFGTYRLRSKRAFRPILKESRMPVNLSIQLSPAIRFQPH